MMKAYCLPHRNWIVNCESTQINVQCFHGWVSSDKKKLTMKWLSVSGFQKKK